MNWLEDLVQLDPIFDIITYECSGADKIMDIKSLYREIPDLLIPILIGKLADQDYCFSQVIRLCYNKNNNEVDICQGYPDIFLRCKNKSNRFILYLIDLVFLKNERMSGRHSESLLIDNQSLTVEFFEPNGSDVSWYPIVTSFLQFKFSIILPDYRFISTGEFCPAVGPQAISSQSICGSFSLLFLMLRVYNPQITSRILSNILTKLSRNEMQDLMRKFICYIKSYAREQNFQQLQNLYEDLSAEIINIPDLGRLVDAAYFALDYPVLEQMHKNILDYLDEIYWTSEKDLYGEFSNFYPSPFALNGITYPTMEHYFQSQKYTGPDASPRSLEYARIIIGQDTPNKAKILGDKQIKEGYQWIQELNNIIKSYVDVSVRSDWNDVRDNIARKGIFQKFIQNLGLLNILLSTGNKPLMYLTSRDNYWNIKLGKFLMEIRSICNYQTLPVGDKNTWIIREILLIGDIDVQLFNQKGVKYLLDLSGNQIVATKILNHEFVQPVSVYQNEFIFVYTPVGTPLEQMADLTIQSLGKGYISYIYADIEIYQKFFLVLFSRLYGVSNSFSRGLVENLLRLRQIENL